MGFLLVIMPVFVFLMGLVCLSYAALTLLFTNSAKQLQELSMTSLAPLQSVFHTIHREFG